MLGLFSAEPDRLQRMRRTVSGIHFDWSKLPLTRFHLEALCRLADEVGLEGHRDRMLDGAVVNYYNMYEPPRRLHGGSSSGGGGYMSVSGEDPERGV
jgi:hypothetical protein